MPFQIQPTREFLVRPTMPEALSRLPDLANDVVWSWEPVLRDLFRRLDPVLWKESGYNPVVMLGHIPQATLAKVASDPRYLGLYNRACQRFDAQHRPLRAQSDLLVSYFSAEYGLTECMPIYSGGLGILSGDHLKSSSDLDLPLVAVGLLYQQGYFRQVLNPDGWQQERYPVNDFYMLPVTPVRDASGADLKVSVPLPSGPLFIQVWKLAAGRVSLYLLDTNIPENAHASDRDITGALYGGDVDTRIRQEIVLGLGGIRALEAMGIRPTVFHMNEGHSAFLSIERIRVLMRDERLSFDEALEASRVNNVFTTHTPVPAGIDKFDPGMMFHYFHAYCREAGIPFDRFMALGRWNPSSAEEPFSMAVLALKTSAYRNGVSKLHREVSQDMFHELWRELPTWEVPITSVTNGVHLPSWLNSDLAELYNQYLQPDWMERCADAKTWELVHDIPAEELIEVHRRRKRRLIAFIRARQVASAVRRKAPAAEVQRAADVLDPNALTIGFARRFATYKRATLIFRDIERLKKILCNKEMPVQIVVAGKAHPRDHPGKALIREIVQFSRDPELWKHLVFVEDYDMKVARELVQGVDLWLNNPKRGQEACGTSGMKAGLNGVLNLSILDGWYDEAYEYSGGWAIGDREEYHEEQDPIHASALYYLLENEIVPTFYERREGGVPAEWIRRVKQSLIHLSPQFDSRRMVSEYETELYAPAHESFVRLWKGNLEGARERARWNARIAEVWDRVRFLDGGAAPAVPVSSGMAIQIRAALDLAGLSPDDVRVEAVLGQVGSSGFLEGTEVVSLPCTENGGAAAVFSKQVISDRTGRVGYAVRVSANHCQDPLTRPCSAFLKWCG